MSLETKVTQGAEPAYRVDYEKSLDCIHCGLCIHSCPTYRLTGREDASPRGRIHLMRALAEDRIEVDDAFRESMDSCLVCHHCESVCPAGVDFGPMMENTRDALEDKLPRSFTTRMLRRIGFDMILVRRPLLRWMGRSLRLVQWLGLSKIAGALLGKMGRNLAAMPPVPRNAERGLMPSPQTARSERIGSVSMLEGCVMPELFGDVNRATAKVLTGCGFDVHTPREHVCCGALHAHNGELETARRLARETIEAFEACENEAGQGSDIVINSAGCGAHMRSYAELLRNEEGWSERAERFSRRLRDLTQLLNRRDVAERLQTRLTGSDEPVRVTYDDPCHLCHGQGIRSEPRDLIAALPGLELVEMPHCESCCGSAGIYSVLRPEDSEEILDPKLDELERSGVERLITANPGCQLQWATGIHRRKLNVQVQHIAELLAERIE
ncbi:MAG: glycolate oxidase iron-sulfur subunit [Planctomycetota bacterium]|jgi:glycolate oxidase iron-sulfur subunit